MWCAFSFTIAKVYTTVVRPALEYAASVWQNIPDFLSYKIESIQKRAMRIIFPLMNYNEAVAAISFHLFLFSLVFVFVC